MSEHGLSQQTSGACNASQLPMYTCGIANEVQYIEYASAFTSQLYGLKYQLHASAIQSVRVSLTQHAFIHNHPGW